MVSQKCQYAIRSVFELARRDGRGPIKIADVAQAQAIPVRFLEAILNQLRQGGFVQSRRGAEGGYYLTRPPHKITVGEIIQFIEGPLVPVACMTSDDKTKCRLHGNCVFIRMWDRVGKAESAIYDQTSFQDLLDEDLSMQQGESISYSI
jgi:Rrf2 family transcriptional regulator, cysteine metabolism repressor